MPEHPNAFAAKITRKLVELRKAEGITVHELAERLDTTPQNIQRIERGQNITLKTLARIAMGIGMRVEVSFVRDPKGPRAPPPGRPKK